MVILRKKSYVIKLNELHSKLNLQFIRKEVYRDK